MAYPRKVTNLMLTRLEQVIRQRLAMPSNKQLARELGCNVKLIERWMTRIRLNLIK
jgi:hypothetical protein